jgi:hypothetical protein
MASFSSSNVHSGKIVKIKSIPLDGNSYKIYSMDLNGNIIIWEFLDKDIKEMYKLDTLPMRKIKEISVENLLKRTTENKKIKSTSLEVKQSNNTRDIIYVLCNIGLIKLSIDVSEQHIFAFIHNNEKEATDITAFSLSDMGFFLCSYSDSWIK